MLQLPVLRWGQPYSCMDVDDVVHFQTGEPIAKVSRANGGLIQRDMRRAQRARDVLREIPIDDLVARVGRPANSTRPPNCRWAMGCRPLMRSSTRSRRARACPERLCRANMKKNMFVLTEMRRILTSLTRGLDLQVLSSGFGEERGVPISYQAQSPVLGLVLPSNSPGVHTLWLPIIPMQIGLVLKPGPQEPWTPFRMAEAFFAAGVPREAISIYPGEAEVGAAVLASCERSLVFGGPADGRSLPRQSEGTGARARLLQDSPWRRRRRRLGSVRRYDGGERVREQRSRLHQLLGDLGEPSYPRDRRGACEAPGCRAPASCRPPGRHARGVHRSRCRGGDLAVDRRGSPGARRNRRDGGASRRLTRRQGRSRGVPPSHRSSTAVLRRRPSRTRNTCSRSRLSSSVRRIE